MKVKVVIGVAFAAAVLLGLVFLLRSVPGPAAPRPAGPSPAAPVEPPGKPVESEVPNLDFLG